MRTSSNQSSPSSSTNKTGVLDQAEAVRKIDAQDMAGRIHRFPDQIREAEETGRRISFPPGFGDGISGIVITGLGGSAIGADALNDRIHAAVSDAARPAPDRGDALPPMSLEEMEKRLIRSVLASTDGNRTRAAEVLGISREGLRTKMQRLGLTEAG